MRQREHALSHKLTPSGHFAVQVRDYGCSPVFDDTLILRRSRNKRAHELYRAQTILSKGASCFSAPFVVLSVKKRLYLEQFTRLFSTAEFYFDDFSSIFKYIQKCVQSAHFPFLFLFDGSSSSLMIPSPPFCHFLIPSIHVIASERFVMAPSYLPKHLRFFTLC